MKSGTVKWFNKERGYGFIAADEGKDVFVHQSDILIDGFRVLVTGQRVKFSVGEFEGRAKAVNVFLEEKYVK